MSLIYTAEEGPLSLSGKPHGLYLGGKVDAKSRSKLEGWGITHILNVTPEKEAGVKSGVANYFASSSMQGANRIIYKRIPVYDAATSDLLSYADSIVSFITSGLHHGSVLVHCQRGVSRSATSVVFFLMRKAGMTMDESMDLCRSRRPVVDPIPAFVEQLRQYEDKCKGVIGKRKALASSKQRKRNRVIGPFMGPQPQALKPDTENESGRRAAIGPQLPSHLTSQGTINKVTMTESTIGPQLPRKQEEDDNKISPSSAAPISPMMPPPSDIKRYPIGPSVDPRSSPHGVQRS